MKAFRISLVALSVPLLLALAHPAGAQANADAAHSLDPFVGRWQTEFDDHQGHNREVWTLSWNEKRTFLHLETESWVDNEPAYVGTGFALYSAPDGEYRLLLMMDNGALHESVGNRDDSGRLRFKTRTYGTNFPDHDTEMSLSNGGMLVAYRFSTGDGGEQTVERRFHKVLE